MRLPFAIVALPAPPTRVAAPSSRQLIGTMLCAATLAVGLAVAPAAGLAQSAADLEVEMNAAIEAAEADLAKRSAELDTVANANASTTLPGGNASRAQAAAGARLWNNQVEALQTQKEELRQQLLSRLNALVPEVAVMAERVSQSASPPQLPTPPPAPPGEDDSDETAATDPPIAIPEGDAQAELDEPVDGSQTRKPLRRAGSDLYRRVLSLPGAALQRAPGYEATARDIKTFTVFYVYDQRSIDGEVWLEVGQSIQADPQGWLAGRYAEEWRNMLVMQFPERVNRNRVLFFREGRDIRQLISSFTRETRVTELYETVKEGKPNTTLLVAIEPVEAIARDERPYLMPILDWRSNVTFADTGDITTLVQVAGLNATSDAPETGGLDDREMSELDIGIAFVIDTTRSMGPYIRAAREIIVNFVAELERESLSRYVDFALVGYRDNTRPNPRIDYVSHIYRDFDSERSVAALVHDLNQVQISSVPTKDWREDAFAGLRMAIEQLSWAPDMDARIIIFITDAGARSGNDPLASHPSYDVLNVLNDAQRSNIAIIPIHLLTPEAVRNDDVTRARHQYENISATAEGFNYMAMALGDEQVYRVEMQAMVQNLRILIKKLNRNQQIAPVEEQEIMSSMTRSLLDSMEQDSDPLEEPSGPKPRLAAIVQNQLFRAQLQYLGRERDTSLPPFYRAWAADLDLSNPQYEALDVRVFLSRNQLNELAEVLNTLLEEAQRAEQTAEGMMQALQHISASVSVDPNLRTEMNDGIDSADDLLPAFLKELPYTSNIFNLSLRDFANASVQLETIEQLKSKLQQYRRINNDPAGWLDLGAGNAGEAVYPLQLRLLP